MKVIVDIENKTLKMLENDRAIFKGEYSADKLILLINKKLVNEFPVITGLLSNGRKIGGYTTDSSYGTETINGVVYTTAEFTLSKENGFTLSEGLTQITIWIYKTRDSNVVSKTAIGNVSFNVVNTTSFNDGDIIIAGDVEGTIVNLKVEVENLQRVAQTNNVAINKLNNDLNDYLPLNGEKSMTGDLKMKDNKIIFEENGKIAQSIDNNLNEYTFPKKSGELALNEDIPTKTSQLTNDSGFALKEEIPTKTSQLENDSNYTTKDDLDNVIEIAEGKTKTYVISTKNNALEFTFEWEPIYIKATTYEDTFTTISNQKIPYRDLKVGDIILITDSKLPDRYLANIMYNGSEYTYVFYNLETRKMDLDDYALKTEIPTKLSELEQDIPIGGGVSEEDVMDIIENNAEQTSTMTIGTSATFNGTSDNQIPTSKAVNKVIEGKMDDIYIEEYGRHYPLVIKDIFDKYINGEFDIGKKYIINKKYVTSITVMSNGNYSLDITSLIRPRAERYEVNPINYSASNFSSPTSVHEPYQKQLTAGDGINIANNVISVNHEPLLEKIELNKIIYDDDEANVNLLFTDHHINIVKPFKVELFDDKLHIYFTPMYSPNNESLDIQVCVYDNVHKAVKQSCIWAADSKLFSGYSIHRGQFDLTLLGQILDEYGITPDGVCYLITEYNTSLVDPDFIYEM